MPPPCVCNTPLSTGDSAEVRMDKPCLPSNGRDGVAAGLELAALMLEVVATWPCQARMQMPLTALLPAHTQNICNNGGCHCFCPRKCVRTTPCSGARMGQWGAPRARACNCLCHSSCACGCCPHPRVHATTRDCCRCPRSCANCRCAHHKVFIATIGCRQSCCHE